MVQLVDEMRREWVLVHSHLNATEWKAKAIEHLVQERHIVQAASRPELLVGGLQKQ